MITDNQLLSLSKFYFSKQDEEVLQNSFAMPVNWKLLYQMTVQHGVVPQVFRQLSRLKQIVGVPEWFEKDLAQQAYKIAILNQTLLSEVKEMASMVPSTRIIALKGAALNLSLYKDELLRSMGDIDVMVPYADAEQVRECFLRHGWKSDFVDGYRSKAHRQEFERTQKSLPYIYKGDYAYFADLHWKFYNGPDDERMAQLAFQTAIPLSDGLLRMSNEMMLIHLSINFAKDWRNGVRLRSLCDIRELLLAASIKWEVIDSYRLPEKVMDWCCFTWSAVEAYFGVKVPAPYRRKHRLGTLSNMLRNKRSGAKKGVKALLHKLKELSKQPYFVRYIWRSIVPASSWLKHHYPTVKMPLLRYWRYLLKRYVLQQPIRYCD